MSASPPLVFVSWASSCSRSDAIAKRLGGTSHMVYSPGWGSRYATVAFKYASQAIKTFKILLRERPPTVLVMTPPVVACVPVWLYARRYGALYAIDAHTGAFVDPRWKAVLGLHRFFSRRAVTTLVTNCYLAGIVRQWQASATLVSDVPIVFPEPTPITLNGKRAMTFISSFTRDEPLAEFLEAVRDLSDVQFFVTGNVAEADRRLLDRRPDNVRFTGFLSGADYAGLLLASDAVICLTKEDHTMQRGAYEAIYLGKPVITSDFGVLREAFNKGAVHTSHRPSDIRRAILDMLAGLATYEADARQLRLEKLAQWQSVEGTLRGLLLARQGTSARVAGPNPR